MGSGFIIMQENPCVSDAGEFLCYSLSCSLLHIGWNMGLGFLRKTGVTAPRTIQGRSSGTGPREAAGCPWRGRRQVYSDSSGKSRVQVCCAARGSSARLTARRTARCVRAGERVPHSVTESTLGGSHCMADPEHWE